MAKKKKSVLKQGYNRGVILQEDTIEELFSRRIKFETEAIAHDNYDDDTMSFTIKIHYK